MSIVDEQGNVVASYQYDPYGNVISATGDLAETNPLRYRGYYYDAETGMYYLQSRYYDPEMGRFINADILISTDQSIVGCNLFAYCNNNPCSFIDPYGFEGFVGFGLQFDVSTDHGTYGFEIVFYLDDEVVYNATQDDSDNLVVAVYSYTGASVNLEELALIPQLYEKLSQADLSYLNDLTLDEQLIALGAILNGCDFSGSFFVIYGYDNFTSPKSYSGPFETWSVKYSGTNPLLSGGVYFSYSDTCWAAGIQGSVSSKPQLRFSPLSVQYSRTCYSDPYVFG